MNALIVNWRDIRNPRAGGAETYLHEIAKRWAARGHRVRFLTAGFRGGCARETIDGVEIRRVGNRATVYAAVALLLLLGFARDADVVVDAENGIPFFTPLVGRKRVALLIFHVHKSVFHSQLPFPFAQLLSAVECRVMPLVYRSSRWITISRSSHDDIARDFRPAPSPVAIVHSGISRSATPGAKAARPTIVYVGRLARYKRLDLAIASAARLRERIPDVRVIVAGAGAMLEELRRSVRVLGLEQTVSLPGYVSEERKLEILREGWVFVSPSSMEGWGIAVIEANACGTPAVAFDVPGLRDAIVQGRTGIIVADPTGLDAALERLIVDERLRADLSREAILYARTFDWDRTARAFFDAVAPGESYEAPLPITRSQSRPATHSQVGKR